MVRTSSSFSTRKNNWNNKYTFPDMLYIDTNVVLDIMMQRDNGEFAENYLTELVKKNGMIIWSSHLSDELYDYFHHELYVSEALKISSPSKAWKKVENLATDKESARNAKIVHHKVERATKYLSQFGLQTDADTEQANKLATRIYSNYGTNIKDSKHVAFANLSGTNNILTQDAGFLRFPYQNIYGSSHTLVNNSKNSTNISNEFVDLEEFFKKE